MSISRVEELVHAVVPAARDRRIGERTTELANRPSDVPIVLVISSDPHAQSEILNGLTGSALVVLAPDGQTARGMLKQIERDRHVQQEARSGLPPDWVIDHRRHEISWRGIPLSLTHHEYDLLTMMAADLDRVWTHDQLHLAVWRTRYLPTATDLQSTVKRMRKKFRDAGVPIGIESVRGVGFRLRRLGNQPSNPTTMVEARPSH